MTSKSKRSPAPTQPLLNHDQLPTVPGTDIAMAASFPGETPSADPAVERLADEITEHLKASGKGKLEVCRLCAEDASKLDTRQRQELIERLCFTESKFSKLVTIGKSDVLRDPLVQRQLQPSWTLMYGIAEAKLTPEEKQKAISEKAFSRNRKELQKWLNENSSHRMNRKSRQKPVDDADHDALLRQLIKAFTGSQEVMAVWEVCPPAVRSRFRRALATL